MKKYELIKETETCFRRRIMYRIRALKDFSDIKAGDVGGWVCSEDNLSQNGDCWIYDDAKCLDNAIMYDSAVMYGNAEIRDNAIMFDKAIMWNYAKMSGNATMYDYAEMCVSSEMFNNAKMFNSSKMSGNAKIFGNATLDKNKILYGSINKSYKKIFQHHCERRLLTAILTEENEILYSIGCQIGITKEKFIDRIYNDSGVMGKGLMGKGLEEYPHRQEYLKIIDMAENYLREFI